MNKDTNYILSLKNIQRTYKLGKRKIPVLKGVDLNVQNGEWISLLGASGSGKTTLLNLIGLLEKPDFGEVYFQNRDMLKMSKNNRTIIRRKKIGFVFQSYHLLPELTVLENVMLPAMLNGTKNRVSKEKSNQLLEHVGLGDRMSHKPGELSGGEQQRAAIARALINDPDLILADEPTGNLDSITGNEIIDLFKELRTVYYKTIIMVTHNREVAKEADSIAEIKDGVISN